VTRVTSGSWLASASCTFLTSALLMFWVPALAVTSGNSSTSLRGPLSDSRTLDGTSCPLPPSVTTVEDGV
jgi:hypothetical protein